MAGQAVSGLGVHIETGVAVAGSAADEGVGLARQAACALLVCAGLACRVAANDEAVSVGVHLIARRTLAGAGLEDGVGLTRETSVGGGVAAGRAGEVAAYDDTVACLRVDRESAVAPTAAVWLET